MELGPTLAGWNLLMKPEERDSNRVWLWFAISSVIFVIVLAISPVKDYLREYRSYFNQYKALLMASADSAKQLRQAQAEPFGIRQIWIPGLGDRVDRCTTCHLGVDNASMKEAPQPFRNHPVTPHTPDQFQKFGCVACHRGQGRATTVVDAHGDVEGWDSPILPLKYTEASCGTCHQGDDVPEASLLSEGRALMRQSGCYGCHEVEGNGKWQSTAPALDGLSQKTTPEWLLAWLKSPRSLRPGTWMPDFHLKDSELESLLAYLWSLPPLPSQKLEETESLAEGDATRGRKVFRSSRCISCHTVEGRGNGSAPELSGVGSAVNRRWLVSYLEDPHVFQPGTEMPRYRFSRQDLLDISQYLMDEFYDPNIPDPSLSYRPSQKAIAEGQVIYKQYGCGGCHSIAGQGTEVPTGPELTGIGDMPVDRLDFGERTDLPHRLPEWLAAKISQPRMFRPGFKMPSFDFAPEQIQAIVTALLSEGSQPIPAEYRVENAAAVYTPPGKFGRLVSEYRCLSCHQVEGFGGDISKAPLTMEGSRVKETWLTDYLLQPHTIRPILTDRMIPLGMPREEAEFMAEFMQNVYVDNAIPENIFPDGAPAESVARGQSLFFERYGCQACHQVRDKGGSYGPLLDNAGNRLRSGWILWWLQGPQSWRADVRCPNYGLDTPDARDLAAYISSLAPAGEQASGGQP